MNDQRTIVITGVSSGLGEYLAKKYHARGDRVFGLDIHPIEPLPPHLEHFLACDVSHPQSIQQTLATLSLQRIDILILCAGILTSNRFDAIDTNDFKRCIDVNLLGSANMVNACLPMLNKGSQIVLIASIAGVSGVYGYSAYSASKFGVIGLGRALRLEFKNQGIDVSLVLPPSIDTPMVRREALIIHPATKAIKTMAGTLSLPDAGDLIFKGIQTRDYFIIPGWRAKFVYWSQKLLPVALTDWVTHKIAQRAIRLD